MQSRVEEESQILRDGQKSKRKGHESSGSSPSTTEPLPADGSSASLVQKPVPLKRSLASETSDDPLSKRARTCSRCSPPSKVTCGIPVPKRNAITSSYSSTGGISQLWKRRGHTSPLFSGPASSHCQQPESHGERATDDTTRKEHKSSMSLPTPGSSGSRKRKRRGDPLTCPLPPLLAYPITPEVHREKKARFEWFSKALEDKTLVASNCVTKEPCLTFTMPAAGPASLSSSLPTPAQGPGATPLLASPKTVEIPDCTPSLPGPADVVSTTTPAPGPGASPLLVSPKTMPNPDCALSLPGPDDVVNTATPAPAKPPSHTLTLPAAGPASLPASLPTPAPDPSASPLLASPKTVEIPHCTPSLPGPADVVNTATPAPAKPPSHTSTLPAAGPASLPASLPTPAPDPGASPLLASPKTVEIPDCTPSLPGPADVVSTTTPAPGPGATPVLASPKTMLNPDCTPSLQGPADGVSTGTPAPAKRPGHRLTLTAERPVSLPASIPTSGLSTIPLVGHLKKVQNLQAPPSFPVAVGVVTTVAPAPPKATGLPAVLSPSHSVTFAGTSSAASVGRAPTSSPVVPMDTSSPPPLQASVSVKLQGPPIFSATSVGRAPTLSPVVPMDTSSPPCPQVAVSSKLQGLLWPAPLKTQRPLASCLPTIPPLLVLAGPLPLP
uniref:Nuclear envelope pore membrane protein POM 121C-like n=1 Tax=Castor canadensis TaxID=51338 RepID=A0A8B7TPL2_CASCN|nr:nuclear envelope pore membrane protein POM 121C-like [Castor canadensis]